MIVGSPWHQKNHGIIELTNSVLKLCAEKQSVDFCQIGESEVRIESDFFGRCELKSDVAWLLDEYREKASEPNNRDREDYCLGLKTDVILIGTDHLAHILRRKNTKRSIGVITANNEPERSLLTILDMSRNQMDFCLSFLRDLESHL